MYVSKKNKLLFKYLVAEEFEALLASLTFYRYLIITKQRSKVEAKVLTTMTISVLRESAKISGLRADALCRYDTFLTAYSIKLIKDSGIDGKAKSLFQKLKGKKIDDIKIFSERLYLQSNKNNGHKSINKEGVEIDRTKVILNAFILIYNYEHRSQLNSDWLDLSHFKVDL